LVMKSECSCLSTEGASEYKLTCILT